MRRQIKWSINTLQQTATRNNKTAAKQQTAVSAKQEVVKQDQFV